MRGADARHVPSSEHFFWVSTLGFHPGFPVAIGQFWITLPPSYIQLERDSGFQFCPVGRAVQRGLARRWSTRATSEPVAV